MIGHCGGLRPTPEDRRLRARPRLSCATITCSTRCCRPKSRCPPSPRSSRRSHEAAEEVSGARRRGPQAADAHRHRGHHRRPQLGAALHPVRAAPVSRAARSASTWKAPPIAAQGYRFRVPYGTLLCVSRQAAPRRDQAARPGQPLLRGGDRRAPADRRHAPASCCAPRARGCTAASCARSTSRRSGEARRFGPGRRAFRSSPRGLIVGPAASTGSAGGSDGQSCGSWRSASV